MLGYGAEAWHGFSTTGRSDCGTLSSMPSINAVLELNAIMPLNDTVFKRAKRPSTKSILLQLQLHSAGDRRRTEEHPYQKEFSLAVSKMVNATSVPQGSASRTNIGVNLLQLTYHMNH